MPIPDQSNIASKRKNTSKRQNDVIPPKIQKREDLRVDFVAQSGATSPSRKKHGFFWWAVVIGIIFLFFIIGLSFISGMVVNTHATDISNVNVIPTVSESPTRTIIQGQDPIVGTWHWTLYDRSKTIFYTFTADGKYSSSDSMNGGTSSGVWTNGGKNQYNVTVNGNRIYFVYQPETDTIANAGYPEIHFYPQGEGPAIVTPTPIQTTLPKTTVTTVDPYAGKCYVNGYYRKSGTYVSGYWRSC
ncbi:hypothetical protein [Methanoregula sp.]|uniref:hypothetical protein n=1 Tax=Methanoregula sp. TaxID=2052170 RepID=UPI003BAF1D51